MGSSLRFDSAPVLADSFPFRVRTAQASKVPWSLPAVRGDFPANPAAAVLVVRNMPG